MARVFLSNETYNAATSGAQVFGAAGTEQVNVFSGTTGVSVASSVERVDLSGNIADFTFSSFGAAMTIRDSAGNIVATVSDSGGKSVVFDDGALSAVYAGTTLSLGGVALTGTAAAIAPAAAAIDATTTSDAPASTGGTTGGAGQTVALTTGIDILTGSAGNDTFAGAFDGAATSTSNLGDAIDGVAGTDTVKITTNQATTTLPSLTNVENLHIVKAGTTASESINAANIAGLTSLELEGGTTIDGATVTVTLGSGQSLILDSITDADAAAATTADGGIGIAQAASLTSLNLTLDGVGPSTGATANNSVVVDAQGTGVTTMNVTATGTNNVNLLNAGGAATTLNVSGTGTFATLTALANSIVTVDASNNTGGVTATLGTGNVTATGGSGADSFTLQAGNDTVNTGAGNDTVLAAGNLTTADTLDGGAGTDTVGSTVALTDALVARLSNFEQFDVRGGNAVNHDVGNFTGLEKVVVGAGLGGAVTVTDMVETAGVEYNAAAGQTLTLLQANAGAGSSNDSMTIGINGATAIVTGAATTAAEIETVTLESLSSGNNVTHTLTGGTFANALAVNINATTAGLTIADLTTVNANTIDASGSSQAVSITTGADTFTSAFLFKGGAGNDVFDTTGATTVAGTIFEVGTGFDSITLDAAVAHDIRTSATTSANAFAVQDDGTTANGAGFVSGTDDIDYNGALNNDGVTTVVDVGGATLQAAVTADANATAFVIADADGDATLEAAITAFAAAQTAANANAVVDAAVGTGLLNFTGLDTSFSSTESVLIAINVETNDSAAVADDGGSAVFLFNNSTATGDTVVASELQLIGVTVDTALADGDFI